jgi:hypothetical protein
MPTYTISGSVLDALGTALAGVAVVTSVGSATTDALGAFSIAGHAASTSYALTPTLAGYTFAPSTRTIAVASANATGQNFIGATSQYGTDAGVESLNKNRNYSTGDVTYTDMARFRTAIEAEITARLTQAGYSVPIATTATTARAIVGQISDFGVAAMAEDSQFMGDVAPDQTTHAMVLWKLYREWLDRYTGKDGEEPTVSLPGATVTTTALTDYPKISLPYALQDDGTAQIFAQNFDIPISIYP